MKFKKYILPAIALISASFFVTGCSDDDNNNVAKAVLASSKTLTFEGLSADPQIVTVYSDAPWVADVPEWITISPETGTGTTDVTISVTDNLRDGTLNNPRKATLAFHGDTKASCFNILIRQLGDNYRDLPVRQIKDIVNLEDEEYVIANNLLVAGKFEGGYMVTDDNGANNLFIATDKAATVGDKVNIKAQKMSELGLAVVNPDEFAVASSGNAVTYPTPVNITANVDTYISSARTYVTVSGILVGDQLNVDGSKNKVVAYKNVDIDLAALNGHFVELTGYYAGTASSSLNIEVVSTVDNGLAEIVYFTDDFEWFEPWSEQAPAGRTIETDDPDATAQQLGTNKVDGVSTYQALVAKGYGFSVICAASKSARKPEAQNYIQRNYIKFGLTGYYSRLELPAVVTEPEAGAKTILAFDWSTMRQNSGAIDPTKLVVIVKNGTDEVQFAVPEHGWEKGSKMVWIHAEIPLEGAKINKNTKITIGNCDEQWPDADARALRWFIDNIKLYTPLY